MKTLLVCLFSVLVFTACREEPVEPMEPVEEGVAEGMLPLGHGTEMERVASELDMGGVRLTLSDGAYEWEAVRGVFDYLSSMILLGVQQGGAEVPPDFEEQLNRLPDRLGFNQVRARGESTLRMEDGRYRTRSVVEHQLEADGLIWSLHGEAFDVRREIRTLPAKTAMMFRFGMNAPELTHRLRVLARDFGVPEELMLEMEGELGEHRGMMDALQHALNGGVTVAVILNPEVEWALPVPGLEPVPEMGVVLKISDAEGVLTSRITEMIELEAPMPLQTLIVEGTEVRSLPLPVPLPSPVALQWARVEGQLLVATSPALMEELLERRGGDAEEAPLLAELDDSIPERVVSAYVMDGRLPELAGQWTQTAGTLMQEQVDEEMPMGVMTQMFSGMWGNLQCVWVAEVRGEVRQSILLHGYPLHGGASQAQLIAAPAMVGLLAAIAMPGFQRARQAAEGNACVNNLRIIEAATDQWAIETGATSQATAPREALLVYFRGNQFPECPAGGVYTVGTVEEPPVCSLGEERSGHALEW